MKKLMSISLFATLLLSQSCSRSNNSTATNTITTTLHSGTSQASSFTVNVTPSTSVLANGSPFNIGGTLATTIGGNAATQQIAIDLNNSTCSYPNFVSGTYNLCSPNAIYTGGNACAANTSNTITYTTALAGGISPSGYSNKRGGTVNVTFNNGVATGTFSFEAYNGSVASDSFPVTGSFSVSY